MKRRTSLSSSKVSGIKTTRKIIAIMSVAIDAANLSEP
jgi:hypothetical protein